MPLTAPLVAEQTTSDELDWTIEYLEFLAPGESIATSVWVVDAGLDQFSPSNDATAATIWLKGGVVGNRYLVSNKITTDSSPPRVVERSLFLFVVEPILVC